MSNGQIIQRIIRNVALISIMTVYRVMEKQLKFDIFWLQLYVISLIRAFSFESFRKIVNVDTIFFNGENQSQKIILFSDNMPDYVVRLFGWAMEWRLRNSYVLYITYWVESADSKP